MVDVLSSTKQKTDEQISSNGNNNRPSVFTENTVANASGKVDKKFDSINEQLTLHGEKPPSYVLGYN